MKPMLYSDEREMNTRTKYALAFGFMQSTMKMMANGIMDAERFRAEVDALDDIWAGIHSDMSPEDFKVELLSASRSQTARNNG